MNDYVIINGVNSNTISGLKISKLPPITKPQMRTLIETIDGRDGDLITDLGYSAYDKQLEIGLWGTYDINTIISFFNQEGTITFSNEADKFYNFKIINQIDYQKLLKFKTAVVVMHCQPFKYPTNETPIEGTPTTITGEGESLTLNNTLEAPMEIDLKGNTYQYSTTGKNYFNAYAIGINTIVIEDNGKTIKMPIASSGNGANSTGVALKILCPTLKVGDQVYLKFDRNLGTANNSFIYLSGINEFWYTTSSLKTITQEMLDSTVYLYGNRYISGETTQCILSDFRIIKNANDSWEKFTYGPSPNPDYPQDIQVVSGDNTIKVEGKNLSNGIFRQGARNSLTNMNRLCTTQNAYLEGGKNYVLSTNLNTSNFKYAVNLAEGEFPIQDIYYDSGWQTTSSFTFTPQQSGYFAIIVATSSGNTQIIPSDIEGIQWQLEKGSSNTSYEPYQSQSYPIQLGDIELCKIGDYQDRIYKDSGKWYLHKEIGKVVLNGSEDWGIGSSATNRSVFYLATFTDRKSTNSSDFFSDNFSYLGNAQSEVLGYAMSFNMGVYANYLYIQVPINVVASQDLANFKTWLSTHNTIVYYVLATPTYTQITDNTLIGQLNALEGANSYDNQTNVSQTNNDYPFWLSASTTFNAPITINNIGNIYAKPILELEGSGNITINLNSQDILSISLGDTTTKIVIDIPNLEAYNPTDSTLMNRLVVGDYMKFLINSGNNTLKIDGTITSYRLTSFTRWI